MMTKKEIFLDKLFENVREYKWKDVSAENSDAMTVYDAVIDEHGTRLRLMYSYTKARCLGSEIEESCLLCVYIPRLDKEEVLHSDEHPIIMQIFRAAEIVVEEEKDKNDTFWGMAYSEVFHEPITNQL